MVQKIQYKRYIRGYSTKISLVSFFPVTSFGVTVSGGGGGDVLIRFLTATIPIIRWFSLVSPALFMCMGHLLCLLIHLSSYMRVFPAHCERSLASCERYLALCHLVSNSCTLCALPGGLSALFGILRALPCSLSPCEQFLHIVSAQRYLVSALWHLVSAALLSVTLWAILAHCEPSPVPCQRSLASCERFFALCHLVSNSCTLWPLPGSLSALFGILWALTCSLSPCEEFLHIVSAWRLVSILWCIVSASGYRERFLTPNERSLTPCEGSLTLPERHLCLKALAHLFEHSGAPCEQFCEHPND